MIRSAAISASISRVRTGDDEVVDPGFRRWIQEDLWRRGWMEEDSQGRRWMEYEHHHTRLILRKLKRISL
jgi:hypothetical protein